MRRPVLFAFVFGLALLGSLRTNAADRIEAATTTVLHWHVLADDEKAIVDRLAAGFFEDSLRLSQSRQIEARTAEIYASRSAEKRSAIRKERRRKWRLMSEVQRQALRGVKRPAYHNLIEDQKAPFRRNALDALDASGAVNAGALAAAMRKEI